MKESATVGTVLLCITEDWFAVSHFEPLVEVLAGVSERLVLLTRTDRYRQRLEALGAEVRHFDFHRTSLDPVKQARVVRRLAETIADLRPDVAHFVSLQTMVAGALATRLARVPSIVYHLTGAGYLVTSGTLKGRILKPGVFVLLRRALARPGALLFVENTDDAELLTGGAPLMMARVRIIPGAGVNPQDFPLQPVTGNSRPVASYVGRMLRSKGVGVLAEAARILEQSGTAIEIRLHGPTDDNPESIPEAELMRWNGAAGMPVWLGRTNDVPGVWRASDICIMAPLVREGMPRAMLEAAASARPLVVSDVPGCRHFVTHGENGLIVPPGNPDALAGAIRRLVLDSDEARRLGLNARARLVEEYATDAVMRTIRGAYAGMDTSA
ncbi:MAG: hypothetical protein RLZ98_611 [Pseudomonadota bacterium]|jgi:glycosyltransferase involved in cell wall biosynthesis